MSWAYSAFLLCVSLIFFCQLSYPQGTGSVFVWWRAFDAIELCALSTIGRPAKHYCSASRPILVGVVTSTGCFSSLAGVVGRLPLVGWCEAILVEALTYIGSPADQYRMISLLPICIEWGRGVCGSFSHPARLSSPPSAPLPRSTPSFFSQKSTHLPQENEIFFAPCNSLA